MSDVHSESADGTGEDVTAKQALEAIANGRLPCLACGVAHEYRPLCEHSSLMTWASAEDGHAYRPTTSKDYAAAVLSGRERQ